MIDIKLPTYFIPANLQKFITLFSSTIFIIFSIIFIFYGRLNADEGWYLYASKLVYQGQIPYKDFAYTLTPLLPYIYGLLQNFGLSNLYLGRVTSVFFSTISLFLSIETANKLSGRVAGALTALFWATFTYGIYFQTITKTYSLLLLLFSSTFYILLFSKNEERRLILASFFVILATLTRLSALFFALPILSYAIFLGTKRVKVAVIALCAMVVLLLSLFALPNLDSASWNLLFHHTMQWGDISTAEKISQVLLYRLPLLFLAYPTYLTLSLIIFVFNFRTVFSFLKETPFVLLIFISLLLFTIPNLVSGGYHSEYFVPWLFMIFPLISVLTVKIFPAQKPISRVLLQTLILSTFLLGLLRGGWIYFDTSGGKAPIDEVQDLALLVRHNSNELDQIFALESLWIVLEADRKTMPGMAMAQFSYYEGLKADAERYNLVNDEIIKDAFREKTPSIIILTDLDWSLLEKSSHYEEIKQLILENYSLILMQGDFGQRKSIVEIYIRKIE